MAQKKASKKMSAGSKKSTATKGGLTQSQKKLPPFIQKAIMKKKGK